VIDKRKARADARPCGPDDMGPVYRAVFGIAKKELKDEKFLRRLKRDYQTIQVVLRDLNEYISVRIIHFLLKH
jgi:hypothetical protein